MTTPNHIGSVCEYLQPIGRALTKSEISDVSRELSAKIKATLLVITCSDGGDTLEVKHQDLMAILYGLVTDAETLCRVIENTGAQS